MFLFDTNIVSEIVKRAPDAKVLVGVAFGRNFIFVTRNRRDFDRITGLKVENWFD